MTLLPPRAVQVTKPTEGNVTFSLPYDEAEVLLRAVGRTNSGNLKKTAPNLYEVVQQLVKEFGRDLDFEARKYGSEVRGNQVYVEEIYE